MREKTLVILLCLTLIIAIGISCRADVQIEQCEYVVKPGDTLWEIATEFAPKGMDKREYIFNIKRNNGLERSDIYPGMVLEIVKEVKEND